MAESMLEKARAKRLAAQGGVASTGAQPSAAVATIVAPATAAKPDPVNPPEARAATRTQQETATPTAVKPGPMINVLVADRTLAVIFGHLGTALLNISTDLRK